MELQKKIAFATICQIFFREYNMMIFRLMSLLICTFIYSVANAQENLDSYLRKKLFFLSPIHSQRNEGYTSNKQRAEFIDSLQNRPQIKKILEIGFNAGHSAQAFLTSPYCEKLVSFDLNEHPYTKVGVEYMQSKYGNKFEFIIGDSRLQIPLYASSHVSEKFDLIFIDGGHTFECCSSDIRNCKKLAHKDTLVWIDDYNIGEVKKAIDTCVEKGLISLLDSKSAIDSSGNRSWVIAQYQMD